MPSSLRAAAEEIAQEETRWLEDAGLVVHTLVREGNVAKCIVDTAREASAAGGFTVGPPRPVQALLDVRCGGDTYTISTGTDGGACTATPPGTNGGGGGTCDDGQGNTANVSCDTGCVSSTGSGSCTGP